MLVSPTQRSPLPFKQDLVDYMRFCWRIVSGRKCCCEEIDREERPCCWCECKASIVERSKL